MSKVLEIRDLTTGFAQQKSANICLHKSINFTLSEGQFIALLGPNGAGKSTLIKTLMGFQKALSGDILFEGVFLKDMNVKELAKKAAIVLTDKIDESFLTVYEIVSTGRYPYTGFTGRLSDDDHAIIAEALELIGLQDFSQRNFQQLSDGEKQKVMIARAVAQQTPIILLDEPVAFIDAPGKVEIMDLLKRLSHEHGIAIIAATHDLTMAVSYADRLWLLGSDGQIAEGEPDSLLQSGALNEIFDRKEIVLNKINMRFEKK